MSLAVIPLILLAFVCGAWTQEVPPPPCVGENPRVCAAKCRCDFCTTNETLADGLLDGSIPPLSLPRRYDPKTGQCVDSGDACPRGFYTVPGSEVRAVNNGTCTHKDAFITAWVCLGLFAVGCLGAVACVVIDDVRRRRRYIAVADVDDDAL